MEPLSEELISVIVPVYNTRDWLSRCVESILHQTYTNLEIILVDDGSTDGSGDLCDAYGLIDPRVQVLHQPNGGQSAARNTGLEAATGDCILFADSDDHMAPDHIRLLHQGIKNLDADLACCRCLPSGEDQVDWPAFYGRYTLFSMEQAACAMLYGKAVGTAPYAKLFRRELWDGVRFPVGQIYEDLAAVPQAVSKAKKIICCPDRSYCYYLRAGSTVRSPITDRYLYAFTALQGCQTLFHQTPDLKRAMACHHISLCMDFLSNPQCDGEVERVCWRYIRQYRLSVLCNAAAPARFRKMALLSYSGKGISRWVLLHRNTR